MFDHFLNFYALDIFVFMVSVSPWTYPSSLRAFNFSYWFSH